MSMVGWPPTTIFYKYSWIVPSVLHASPPRVCTDLGDEAEDDDGQVGGVLVVDHGVPDSVTATLQLSRPHIHIKTGKCLLSYSPDKLKL